MISIPRLLQIRLKECHETVKMQHAPLSALLPDHQNRAVFLRALVYIVLIRSP